MACRVCRPNSTATTEGESRRAHLAARAVGRAPITSARPPTFDHGATSDETSTICLAAEAISDRQLVDNCDSYCCATGGAGRTVHGDACMGRGWGPGGRSCAEMLQLLTCSFLSALAIRRCLCRCDLVHTVGRGNVLQSRQCCNAEGPSWDDGLITWSSLAWPSSLQTTKNTRLCARVQLMLTQTMHMHLVP